MRLWLAARRPSTFAVALRKRFVLYFALIAAGWLPWIILTWPGAMRDDTMAQYLQAMGLHHYYTQHPLFDTLIFGLFWRFGAAVFGSPLAGQAVYTVVQAFALAVGIACTLCYIRKLGAPLWLVAVGLVYSATSYVVVASTTTMGKDSLHAAFFLPFAVIFTEACLTRGRVLRRMPVAIAFTLLAFAVIASKRTALIIVVCAGIGLLCVCDGRRTASQSDSGRPADSPADSPAHRPDSRRVPRLRRPIPARLRAGICLIVAIVLAQGVFTPIANAVTHAVPSPGREVWGIITQPVARLAHDDPAAISSDQRRVLDTIMELDKAAATINPHRSDETFHTLREPRRDAAGIVTIPGPTVAQKVEAVRVWARLGRAHPLVYARAYAAQTRGWWDPRVNFSYPTDSDYLLRGGYLRQWSTYLSVDEVRRAGVGDTAEVHRTEGTGDAAAITEEARMTAIARDLAPLVGTSNRPQWCRDVLRDIRDWARGGTTAAVRTRGGSDDAARAGNPLTGMALYVTWIPLAVGIALMTEAVMRSRRGHADGHMTGEVAGRYPSGRVVTASPGSRLAAFGLLAFTVLSLYASPEALFWYPIPVFASLPLFVALPFILD